MEYPLHSLAAGGASSSAFVSRNLLFRFRCRTGIEPSHAPRRRVSKRTYLVRRFGALVLVMAVLFGSWSLISSVFGGSDGATAEPITPATNTVVNDGVTPTTLPPTTTTQPPPKEKTVPSAADPAEVLIVGDSDAGTFGPYLKTLVDQTGIATTQLEYKTSSGLARPDFFDWPSFMRQIVPQANPDIVIATFGGNDAQGLRNVDKTWAVDHAPASGADDSDWKAEYGARSATPWTT